MRVLCMLRFKVVVEVPLLAAYHVGAVHCMGANRPLCCDLTLRTAC
jgi:hypothetical protein